MTQIPVGWKETTLGNLIYSGEIQIKNFLRKPISSNERSKIQWEYPYYWAASAIDSLNSFSLEGLHLLIAEDWTVVTNKNSPMLQLVEGKFNVSNHAHILQGNDNQETRFLYYLLSNVNILPYITWAVQPKLSKENLLKICFLIPESLPEQQAIAAVLSSFDDKIELLRAENQTLEQMGQELFKERFGKWKIGDELPEGWRVGKLGKEIKFIKGKKPKAVSDSYKEGRIPQVLIETLDGWISLFADPEKSILLNSGEIVMVMDGASSGRCEIGFSWVLWSTLAKIEVNPSLKLMLYALLKNKFKEINGWTTGSSIPHTDKHKICDFDFIIPTKETLYDFNKLYWNLIEKILLNRKQIQTLSVTRDQLLPKLMSGEVRVEF